MGAAFPLTYTTAVVLQALAHGYRYGFDIMDATGLPSGTVYPILRRLERRRLVGSKWEKEAAAFREQRPPRRYYELTAAGAETCAEALRRFRGLERAQPALPGAGPTPA
ncbi:MAG: PadR family transcriptional regulator [Gemmatimonadaceae bacterium]